MIPGAEDVTAADLRVGDCVWVAVPKRASWAMVIAVDYDLATLTPAAGLHLAFDDGTEIFCASTRKQTWRRCTGPMAGFRREDIARGVEHAEKTVKGLQQKIARLRRLQGLVDMATAARKD